MLSNVGYQNAEKDLNAVINKDTSTNSAGGVSGTNRAQVCKDVAEKIQVAIFDFTPSPFPFVKWNYKWTEDEEEVINQLNRLNSATEARIASTNYQAVIKGFDRDSTLKKDVQQFVTAADRKKIKDVVLINLM